MNAETAKQLQTYIKALEVGDFDTMLPVLESAQFDPELERFIEHYHAEIAEDVQLTPEQHAKIQQIIERHKKAE